MMQVKDPRSPRIKKHSYREMLCVLICGFLAGKMNVHKICTWAQGHLPFLRKNLRLTGGIASEATFSRMLASIDEYELAELFMTWVAEILRLKGIHVVIDGKALRAAAEKNENKKPPYVLNALDAATKLVIAQLPIMDKSCEKSRIPDLLSYLCDSSTDETFTIDAIGTDDEIMRKINENGCSFVFTLKKNNPAKYEEAIDVFRDFIREEDKKKRNPPSLGEERVDIYDDYQSMITLERNRDRYECRIYKVCYDMNLFSNIQTVCPYVVGVGYVRRIRIKIQKNKFGEDITPPIRETIQKLLDTEHQPDDDVDASDQEIGIALNRVMTVQEMAHTIRDHWRIENSLHYVLDMDMLEDKSTNRKGKNNLALIRKIVYNIVRLSMLEEGLSDSFTDALDTFNDPEHRYRKICRYVFSGIPSLY